MRTGTGFRNSGTLTRSLVILIWLNIVLAVMSGASGLIDVKLWLDFQAGIELTPAQADIHEWRQQIISTIYFLGNLPLIIVFCIWIYRANDNARRLGAINMRFTPGWAVGWYFIPIMNLWMPYQVMKEIWQASASPTHWQDEPHGSILPLWWTFLLLTAALSIFALRYSMSAEAPREMTAFWWVSVAGDAIEIISLLIALALVRRIYRMQVAHSLSAAFR